MTPRVETDPEWRLEPCALGAATGSLMLNIMNSSRFSSFRQPAEVAFEQLNALNTVVGQVEVPVRRLDAIDAASPRGRRVFLKLDTQGFDLEVLRGAAGILPDVVAVQTEASVVPIYQGMPSFAETLEAFRASGFSLANAAPVTRDPGLRAIEFDLVFVNDAHAEARCRDA
jgi:FkbM family methyltransferase